VAGVGSVLTARCGEAPTSPPWQQPKSLAAAPRAIFRQALKENGWREAHNGHIYKRLVERGAALGIKTPNDFARALRDGTTEDAEEGASRRVCRGGNCWVIFRGGSLITIRHPKDE